MPATTRLELGETTLAKKWYLDVNTGTHASPSWLAVNAINNFKPDVADTKKDDSDYAGEGWGSDVVTKRKWTNSFKAMRKVKPDNPLAYDEGQEFLRAAADSGNVVEVRWYEMPDDGPRQEAYQGYATVTWSPDGGSDEDFDVVSVTLNGKGRRTAITHPDAAAVPRVFSVSPATAATAGGELVIVTGWGFTGITGAAAVKVGGTNATDYEVVSNSKLAVVVPAKAGGAHAVVVTNGTGPSTDVVTITYS